MKIMISLKEKMANQIKKDTIQNAFFMGDDSFERVKTALESNEQREKILMDVDRLGDFLKKGNPEENLRLITSFFDFYREDFELLSDQVEISYRRIVLTDKEAEAMLKSRG